MNLKSHLLAYFGFSRKESIAAITLILLIVAIFLYPAINPPVRSDISTLDSAIIQQFKSIEHDKNTEYAGQKNNHVYEKNGYKKPEMALFYFDPNTLSPDGWEKLGLRPKTIQIILNYRSKGGYFKKPEDLKRIYSLQAQEYNRISPYIRIKQKTTVTQTPYKKAYPLTFRETNQPFRKKIYWIEINSADTAEWIALPGIGSKLASRIVHFREKLGGFYSVNQLSETYGLPDSTFQKIKEFLTLEPGNLKRLNLNHMDASQLSQHPYITWNMAKTIISYRDAHGPFTNLEDLKKVHSISETLYVKIHPYLDLQ